MRHILISLLLLAVCSPLVMAQDCPVQVFLSEYSNVKRAIQYDSYVSGYTGWRRYDYAGNRPYSPTRRDGRNQIHDKFLAYLNNHGFSTVDGNTRMGIHLKYNDSPTTLELEISLYDTKSHLDVYTAKIDTVYQGDKLKNIVSAVSMDFPNNVPHFEEVIDSIRKRALELYESTADSWIEDANQLAAKKKTKKAMFLLSQFPSCCPSYPKVRTLTATLFRDYVNQDNGQALKLAKQAWNSNVNETEARFVIALLNSMILSDRGRRTAETILQGVALYYPDLDLTAHEDYTAVPELADVAVKLANQIGQ